MVVAGNNNMFANFTSKPCLNIDWGPCKKPRCIKQSTRNDDNGGKTEAVTDELTMLDLGAEAKQRNADSLQIPKQPDSLQIPKQAVSLQNPKQPDSVKNSGALQNRPWNLRTKRTAVSKWEPEFFPKKKTKKTTTTTTNKLNETNGIHGDGCGVLGRIANFSVCLTEKEIAEDFLATSGKAPTKRPKKLPRKVQNDVDYVSPAHDLAEHTASLYEDIKKLRKRFIRSQLHQRSLLFPRKQRD